MTRQYFVHKVIPRIISEIGDEATIDELNKVIRYMAQENNVPNPDKLVLV